MKMFTKLGNQWVKHHDFEVMTLDKDFILYIENDHSIRIYSEPAFDPYRLSINISEIKCWDKPENEAINSAKIDEIASNIKAAWNFLGVECEFV
jgi:hypothetical protein